MIGTKTIKWLRLQEKYEKHNIRVLRQPTRIVGCFSEKTIVISFKMLYNRAEDKQWKAMCYEVEFRTKEFRYHDRVQA